MDHLSGMQRIITIGFNTLNIEKYLLKRLIYPSENAVFASVTGSAVLSDVKRGPWGGETHS
jgi:hypothetical protein